MPDDFDHLPDQPGEPPARPINAVRLGDVIGQFKDRFPEAMAHGEEAKAAEPPPARVKTWAETVRPQETYRPAGVERVETTSPDMTGVRFSQARKRTDDEKEEMEARGIKYWKSAESWLKKATPQARDETKALARSFAERRRAVDAFEEQRKRESER